VGRWMIATEVLAATGAQLTLAERRDAGDPDVTAALRAVSAAAGLPALDELAPPQRDTVAALIRMCLRQAQDLVDDPGRPPGWTFTHPDILTGWGRGSMLVPGILAAAAPQFTDVRSFLDVGTGRRPSRHRRGTHMARGDRHRHRHLGAGPADRDREHQGRRARGPCHRPA